MLASPILHVNCHAVLVSFRQDLGNNQACETDGHGLPLPAAHEVGLPGEAALPGRPDCGSQRRPGHRLLLAIHLQGGDHTLAV